MKNEFEAKLEELRSAAILGGGASQIEKQHAKGKKTARERIEMFLDPGTFIETGLFVSHRATGFGMESSHPATDGVVTGWGKVDGRVVYVFAQDFTILGGSLGEAHGRKIAQLMDLAYQNGSPLIGLNNSGARASRKAWIRWHPTVKFSSATRGLQVSSRRYRSSWDPARAAQCTRPG